MKKTTIVWCVVLVLVLAICGIVGFRISKRNAIPDGTSSEQVAAILRQNDCYACHSNTVDEPFYAKLPLIGPKMREHITHAQRFITFNEDSVNLEHPSEVFISMMEHCASYETMPIADYKMVHLGTGLSKDEREAIIRWANEKRSQIYVVDIVEGEPVQLIPSGMVVDTNKAELGCFMFNDTRISKDCTISCATCHILKDGGADEPTTRTSEGINGNFGGVNAPTVYNALFNIKQFWNGRANNLQQQAAGPPVNPVEMGDQTWDEIVARLNQDAALVARFRAIYPNEGLTQNTVTDAIAEYEKTLLTPNSRFDLYLKGDKKQLSKDEIAGYELFKASGCANCHVGRTLGGQSFELLGIFDDYFAARDKSIKYNSDDDGLKSFTHRDADLHKFKVPGLRNVELTPPYFHDGSYATLEKAVKAMYRFELGKTPSDQDVKRITAFLRTLNGINPNLHPTAESAH